MGLGVISDRKGIFFSNSQFLQSYISPCEEYRGHDHTSSEDSALSTFCIISPDFDPVNYYLITAKELLARYLTS